MNKIITAIKAEARPGSHRSRIYLDGSYGFSLDDKMVAEKSLVVGRALTPAEVVELSREDDCQGCYSAAMKFISYRSRSESETRERLLKRGFETQYIEPVIEKLRQAGWLDDSVFARSWTEDRDTFKPRSQRVLKMELRRKGIDSEIIDAAVAGSDEEANARQLAMHKARTLPVTDFQVFRRRLGAYLQRKGFDYAVINSLVKEAWQERTMDQAVEVKQEI
jgi:regulatory protein